MRTGIFVYNNAKHSEEEGTEALFYTPNDVGKITTYLVESTTVLATRVTVDDNFYDIYAVNCPSELSFRGMDRGMFEMFIVVFLVVGILATAEFCCSARFFRGDSSGIFSHRRERSMLPQSASWTETSPHRSAILTRMNLRVYVTALT